MKLPIVDLDNPPRYFGTLSEEEKEEGIKALQHAINHTNDLIERQKKSGSKNYNLRNYENK